jgi:hypothetical protein
MSLNAAVLIAELSKKKLSSLNETIYKFA